MRLPARTLVYLLLFTGCTINYLDRVALSVAARPIATSFHVSPVGMGYLFSAFLWLYVLASIPWGVAVDRIGTRIAGAAGMAFWSAATVITGSAASFASLFACRLAMGLGEASIYPVGGRVIREWIPARERGLASTVFNSGGYAGPAIGTILVAWLVTRFGWRVGFVVVGAVGFVWLVVWLAWFHPPERSRWVPPDERRLILAERGTMAGGGGGLGVADLLRWRSTWGLLVTQGCAVYMVYFLLTWLPSYMQVARHLTLLRSGVYLAIPYAAAVPGTILLGLLSDRLLRRNGGLAGGARRRVVATLLLVSSLVLLVPLIAQAWIVLILFAVCLATIASVVGLNIALQNDLLIDAAGAGRANALLVTGGNLVGVAAPIATGYLVGRSGSYDGAFVVAGVLQLVGLLACLTLSRRPVGATA